MQINDKPRTKSQEHGSEGNTTSLSSVNAAEEASLAKVDFYQTDKWVIGPNKEVAYVVPKNSVPQQLLHAFAPSSSPNPITEKATYDRKKFGLDEYPDFETTTQENAGVVVHSHEIQDGIACIGLAKDTFTIHLFTAPKSGSFPFTKDEFLKAVDFAKWQLELFVLPQLRSDSDAK